MSKTYTDINGRLRKQLIRPIQIMIVRAEGPTSLCGKIQIADSWSQADVILRGNSTSAPKGGFYDKHDFKVTFADGTLYEGRYDLKHWEEEIPDLRNHILGFMRYMSGVAPSWMKDIQLAEYLTDLKKRSNEVAKARIWLETYDVGQEPPFVDEAKVQAEPKIRVRFAPVHKTDDKPYRADIIGDGFDHHGIADNPAEALLLAAQHWVAHTEAKAKKA